MDVYSKTFCCLDCNGKMFNKSYSFIVNFKTVNFTDDLIYDEKDVAVYVCKDCGKEYTYEFIREYMKDYITKYKNDNWWEGEKGD